MAIKKMTEMIFFSLAALLFKNMSNIASLFSFMGNNADEAGKIPAVITLRIVTVRIRMDPAGSAETVSNRKIDYVFGCDRAEPARFNTHRAIPSLGRRE
jgi:hypothetical protein